MHLKKLIIVIIEFNSMHAVFVRNVVYMIQMIHVAPVTTQHNIDVV